MMAEQITGDSQQFELFSDLVAGGDDLVEIYALAPTSRGPREIALVAGQPFGVLEYHCHCVHGGDRRPDRFLRLSGPSIPKISEDDARERSSSSLAAVIADWLEIGDEVITNIANQSAASGCDSYPHRDRRGQRRARNTILVWLVGSDCVANAISDLKSLQRDDREWLIELALRYPEGATNRWGTSAYEPSLMPIHMVRHAARRSQAEHEAVALSRSLRAMLSHFPIEFVARIAISSGLPSTRGATRYLRMLQAVLRRWWRSVPTVENCGDTRLDWALEAIHRTSELAAVATPSASVSLRRADSICDVSKPIAPSDWRDRITAPSASRATSADPVRVSVGFLCAHLEHLAYQVSEFDSADAWNAFISDEDWLPAELVALYAFMNREGYFWRHRQPVELDRSGLKIRWEPANDISGQLAASIRSRLGWSNEINVTELMSFADLCEEGAAMHHCLGSLHYLAEALCGRQRIFSVRRDGRRLATMAIRDTRQDAKGGEYVVSELAGPGNQAIRW